MTREQLEIVLVALEAAPHSRGCAGRALRECSVCGHTLLGHVKGLCLNANSKIPTDQARWTPKPLVACDCWKAAALAALPSPEECEREQPIKIVITLRYQDFHAQIEGEPDVWGCGPAPTDAIGNLVSAHYDRFGVAVRWTNGSTTANWPIAAAQKGGAL